MAEFCTQVVSSPGGDDRKDSPARKQAKLAERQVRTVKRRAARELRELQRRYKADFKESLKYGIKARVEKLTEEIHGLKKEKAKWTDEKLMCDAKLLEFKDMQDRVKQLDGVQKALDTKAKLLAANEQKVQKLQDETAALKASQLDKALAKRLGMRAERNKQIEDLMEKLQEEKTEEAKLKSAIGNHARNKEEQHAKSDIKAKFANRQKVLATKEKGVKLQMKADQKRAALQREETTVLDERQAADHVEQAKEPQLSELKVKADIKNPGTDRAAESKAKAELRRAYSHKTTKTEQQERKVKYSGETVVKKSDAVPKIGPEGQLEEQREKEVAEAKEKSTEKVQGTDERREKTDIRKGMASTEKKMEVSAGVQELKKAEDKQKQEVANVEAKAEKDLVTTNLDSKSDPNSATLNG